MTEIHVRSGDVLAGQKVSAMLPVKGPLLSADLEAGAKGGQVTVIVGHDFADAPQREASAVR